MAVNVVRNPVIDVAPMKNESVLFQPQTNQFCLLNVTATFIWNQLEHPHSNSELAEMLCDHFDGVSSTEASQDVEQIVSKLLTLNFLTSS
jgi:hypothetical protein